MIEIIRFDFGDELHRAQAFSIRQKVFVVEQSVDPAEEYEFEEESHHFLLLKDGTPAMTARWRETEKGIKLERFAMLQEYRNQGLGSVLLQEIVKDVIPFKKKIYMHAQLKAVPFYERAGFVAEGEIFEESKILHYKMVLR
ncbi:MAG: GNAT family N-acetyltransferase [Bacteroidota bacterium]